jgi:cation:H+ antiporter
MTAAVLAVLVGLALLVVASDWFVIGAAGVSFRLGVPAVVVGAVVIGFGTSAPEFLVSALAASEDARDIAIGNIVGSNLANLTLVLGVVALVAAPRVTSRVLLREIPLMVVAMAAMAWVLQPFGRVDGVLLVALFVVSMALLLVAGRETGDPIGAEAEADPTLHRTRSWRRLAALTVGGLAGTVAGAQLLVTGAREIADRAGLEEGFVGFTIVALGTSLPEVVTAIQAARRGEPDLAIGNVVGSNLFNSLAVASVVAFISPGSVSGGLAASAWIVVGAGAGIWLLMWTSRRLVRWEAVVLIGVYLATLPVVS